MSSLLQSMAKIRFQDCDPFNHLNNTRYLDYFLNAREDQLLASYKLNVFQHMQDDGLAWVVSSNQICYLAPVTIGESVLIDSRLIDFTTRSLKVEMRMWNQEGTQLKSMLWSKFTYVNLKSQKPAMHSDGLMQLFTEINSPVDQLIFEERRSAIIRQVRGK